MNKEKSIDIRNTPSPDYKKEPKMWKLTPAQWLVYYWLLAHSEWNSKREQHYYIYDNTYTKQQIRRECGIGSVNTVTSAFKRLEKDTDSNGNLITPIIERDPMGRAAYILNTPPLYTPLDVRIIKFLMEVGKGNTEEDKLDASKMISVYSILRRWYVNTKHMKKKCSFSLALLSEIMGIAVQNMNKYQLFRMLSVFEFAGLAEFSRSKMTNNYGVEYVEFTILSITNTGEKLESYFNDEGEVIPKAREIIDKEISPEFDFS